MYTAPQLSGNPETVYDKFRESLFADLHVATIGTVTAVGDGVLTVKPIINDRIVMSDGTVTWQEYPEIPDTPYIGSTPDVGSLALIIFCDHDISCLMSSTGSSPEGAPNAQNQEILRSHNLSNAVAITGLNSNGVRNSPPASYPGNEITASKDDCGIGVSYALIEFIKSHEGFVSTWYNDNGHPAIGYGHDSDSKTLPLGLTAPLSQDQAVQLLKYDIQHSYLPYVQSIFSGMTFVLHQTDALVDFCYALGPGTLQNSSLAKDIKAGVTDSARLKADFEAYCKLNGVPNDAVKSLRTKEWNIYCNNEYTSY